MQKFLFNYILTNNREMFDEICIKKNCKCLKVWDFGYGSCWSCTKIGQSYHVYEYPEDCLFLKEMQSVKEHTLKLANTE